MKTYRLADDACRTPFEIAIAKHHPELADKVNVAIIMVMPALGKDGKPTAPAVSHAGSPAFATIQITSAKDHPICPHDAVIRVDEYKFDLMPIESQVALFDHELSHLELMRDKNGQLVSHDNGRPKIQSVPDDYALTGFFKVWQRHGKNAIERIAIGDVLEEAHERKAQMTFGFMESAKPVTTSKKSSKKKTAKKSSKTKSSKAKKTVAKKTVKKPSGTKPVADPNLKIAAAQ